MDVYFLANPGPTNYALYHKSFMLPVFSELFQSLKFETTKFRPTTFQADLHTYADICRKA